jgi:hypothetical protein
MGFHTEVLSKSLTRGAYNHIGIGKGITSYNNDKLFLMQHLKQMKVKYGFIFSTQKSDGQIST